MERFFHPNPLRPPRPGRIIEPSVFSLPAGTERYVIEGASAALIQVKTGDQLTITNDEGAQLCELVIADHNGRIDPSIIGATASGPARGLQALLDSADPSLSRLRRGIETRAIDISQPGAVHLFEQTTPAGTSATFQISRDATLILAAPAPSTGGIMDFEAQNTATPLTVMIQRAQINPQVKFKLPDPLADPLKDLRIHAQTAESYFVKAGEFIQILDVDGRQCTDFQCFSARKLDTLSSSGLRNRLFKLVFRMP